MLGGRAMGDEGVVELSGVSGRGGGGFLRIAVGCDGPAIAFAAIPVCF